jgi:hypothetical protein
MEEWSFIERDRKEGSGRFKSQPWENGWIDLKGRKGPKQSGLLPQP